MGFAMARICAVSINVRKFWLLFFRRPYYSRIGFLFVFSMRVWCVVIILFRKIYRFINMNESRMVYSCWIISEILSVKNNVFQLFRACRSILREWKFSRGFPQHGWPNFHKFSTVFLWPPSDFPWLGNNIFMRTQFRADVLYDEIFWHKTSVHLRKNRFASKIFHKNSSIKIKDFFLERISRSPFSLFIFILCMNIVVIFL